jgi:chemotaxis response regulator CheB
MESRDIVVIGTSLGGIEALKVLVASFPAELKAAILVVLHIASFQPGRRAFYIGTSRPAFRLKCSRW